MTLRRLALAAAALAAVALAAPVMLRAQRAPGDTTAYTPAECPPCAGWNAAERPFRIHGNSWWVGTRGLGAILVTSPDGHVLIDGGLPESAPLIMANVRALGFRVEDVRVILNSHAHYDHAGGVAALQRVSGATVVGHPWSVAVMRAGATLRDDPQHDVALPFPPARGTTRAIAHGDTVRVGPLALVAHFTGGHTPGGTTWSWRSCEGERCWELVYADSQTPISDDGFLYTRSERYADAVRDFERGHARIERLACDVLLTPHPGFARVFERRDARDRGDADAFREPTACRGYAAWAREQLARRVERERQ